MVENLSSPMAPDLGARVERERAAYDAGIDRKRYVSLLASHAGHQAGLARARIAEAALSATPLRRVLELGEWAWLDWLERTGLAPAELVCVNISQRELDHGIIRSRHTRLKPTFMLMDAHDLAFPDGHFDAVIGWGILHHLDLGRALDEVARVLAPGGVMVFSEPLDMNPVARLVRRLTPKARTPDEIPFRAAELAAIRARFDVRVTYEQLLSVPVGVASRLLLPHPDNPLTRAAHAFDHGLQRRLPRLGAWYRKATFVGRPRR